MQSTDGDGPTAFESAVSLWDQKCHAKPGPKTRAICWQVFEICCVDNVLKNEFQTKTGGGNHCQYIIF